MMRSPKLFFACALLMASPPLSAVGANCAASTALLGEPPAALLAMMSSDCFDQMLQGSADARQAVDYGFPSRLFGLLTEAEAADLITMAAQEGDRGFIAFDPEILEYIERLPQPTADFVTASLAPEATLQTGKVSQAFLMALPLWENPKNSLLLTEYCETYDCQPTKTRCPDQVGLADKLAVANGSLPREQAQTLCPLSFEWLRALRQAGLVDTSCTSTMQINRTMAAPEFLDAICYSPSLSLQDLSAVTPADAVRYLRQSLIQNPAGSIPGGSIEYIASHWPHLAGYLEAMAVQGGDD